MTGEDEAVPDNALSGDPSAAFAGEAVGTSWWLARPHGVSLTGGQISNRLGAYSWAVFEWARNPYILVVWIYLFAPYFVTEVVGSGVRGQALWGAIAAYGGAVVAILAPLLGAIADAGGRRKPWIALFTLIMAAAMFGLWEARPHAVGWALVFAGACVALTNISYEFSAVFHNALLPSIAEPKRIAGLSGLGYALGNAAGIVLLLFMLIAFALPGRIGWSFVPAHPLWGVSQALFEPERLGGPVCAIWLLVFCLPLFFFTPDRPSSQLSMSASIRDGIGRVAATIASLRQYRNVGAYLLARLFFNDGMTAVLTFGGIYAATTFHWGTVEMLLYGIELSIFAVFGGFFGGWLDNRFGSKRAIFVSIGGTSLFGLLSLTMAPDRILWFIHYDLHAAPIRSLPFFNTWPQLIFFAIVDFIAVSIVAGYANSRTMLARIAPPEKVTEFFGLYSLSGTSTTFLATGFVGWLTAVSQNQRIGLLGEMLFLGVGLILMLFVSDRPASGGTPDA